MKRYKPKPQTKFQIRCPAKINLTFEILGTRHDGYHEVQTLLQAISLADELTFSFSEGTGKTLYLNYDSSVPGDFPRNDSNLISKAIQRFRDFVPEAGKTDVKVSIKKAIPIAAGLAGGSANAAAALRAMNAYHPYSLSEEQILDLGSKIGADVPFAINGGTCVGTGRGDILTPVEHESKLWFLLAKPRNLEVSTPWAFQEFDKRQHPAGTRSNTTMELVSNLKVEKLDVKLLHNDLESVLFSKYPALEKVREIIESMGALVCRLTGSGPTLYAIVEDREAAAQLRNDLVERCSKLQTDSKFATEEEGQKIFPLDFYIAESVDYGVRIIIEGDEEPSE